MLAAAQPLSATRQNLWRLTVIRVLVLAAQAGSVGVAYWTELLPLPWLSLAATLALSSLLCAFTALRLRSSSRLRADAVEACGRNAAEARLSARPPVRTVLLILLSN